MNIEQIATRFTDRPHPEPGDIAIDHPYRTRWWLPIIGATATYALTHLTTDAMSSDWQLTPASELAVSLGLGKGTATNSPLIRSLLRLTPSTSPTCTGKPADTSTGQAAPAADPPRRSKPLVRLRPLARVAPETTSRWWVTGRARPARFRRKAHSPLCGCAEGDTSRPYGSKTRA